MKKLKLILHCYKEHKKDFEGNVKFKLIEYFKAWFRFNGKNKSFKLVNRNKSEMDCIIVYYPLPYYADLRALVEIGHCDFREVPIYYLK
jgi:hypothetical protein